MSTTRKVAGGFASPFTIMDHVPIDAHKFKDSRVTLTGSPRASVQLQALETLWVNTGTLCNLSCANCYIESSPTNDRLGWFLPDDLRAYLDEEAARDVQTIGFTGGEPFMNPHIIALLEMALSRGHKVLVLTNAMRPMEHCRGQLNKLRSIYGNALALRVSLDHHTQALHEAERGGGTWIKALDGLSWLAANCFNLSVAGRMPCGETEAEIRTGYQALFDQQRFGLAATDVARLTLFAEMDERADVPEISVDCWDVLGARPDDMMCASSRMVVRRKGADAPSVIACTLLPDDPQFDLGPSLDSARGIVSMNHPHCARFCALGGSRCTG